MAYEFANVKIYHNVPIEECIIVMLVDGIRTLVDVIIVNPIRVDLISPMVFSHGVVMTMATQVKEGFYCDCYLMDMFFALVIKVFRSLHQLFDNIFHQCANMAWIAKGIRSLLLLVLCSFYR
jgi:membrane-associated PAP2 superfamily phosphatase